MINCLVIGLGIGQLYCSVNKQLGHAVYTVDTTKPADFTSVEAAVNSDITFDIVHICTPNASHESIARTVAAANDFGPHLIINKICDRRESFYKSLPGFSTFGKGWMNRAEDVRKKALEMAA